jgi:DNA replication and repair protein RecF
MLRQIDGRLVHIFRELAGTDETLRLAYRSTACPPEMPYEPASDLAASFRRHQSQLATREIDQAQSLVGPHRDDFTFLLDDVDLNRFGSRGQQRLAVVALKLAEADWMRDEIGELPVVLLDDVLSELDTPRRGYVLHRVAEPEPTRQRQVWITTTETSDFSNDFLSSAQRFVIDAGHVRTA